MDVNNKLPEKSIAKELEKHPLWTLNDNGQLSRKFEAKNFVLAMEFLQQVGIAAERAGHHPDLHLTEYRRVELVLYTHSVNGVTKEDIKMLDVLDDIPVVYSAHWKKTHHGEATRLKRGEPQIHSPKLCTFKHYRQDENVLSNTKTDQGGLRPIHSSMYTDDGRLLHEHDFKVHTGPHVQIGHSDAPHYEITPSIDKKTGLLSYETEMQHANMESTFGKVHPQHGQLIGDLKQPEFEPPYTRQLSDAKWEAMRSALVTLIENGYDVAEADSFLPMFESHTIHPNLEKEVYLFYLHMKRRVSKEWEDSEPSAIIQAAQLFVDGYEDMKGFLSSSASSPPVPA